MKKKESRKKLKLKFIKLTRWKPLDLSMGRKPRPFLFALIPV